jgi:tetratricopeptide (TPR) repeat protein
MTFKFLLSILLSCCVSISLFGQTTIHIRNGCHYDDDQLEQDIYAYAASDEAQQIIGRITAIMGLKQNFTIKAASIKNALATADGRQRYILYSTAFLENFKRDSSLRWAAYGVLAHEIGHHLNYHDFNERDPKRRRDMEVEADFFSGNILQKLGASFKQAQACISTFCLDGESDTHPSKNVRLDAVANGWKQALGKGERIESESINQKNMTQKFIRDSLAKECFEKGHEYSVTEYEKSIAQYTKAIIYKPDFADAYFSRGYQIYYHFKENKGNNEDFIKAIDDLSKAIDLAPDSSKSFFFRGLTRIEMKMYNDAIKDFDIAINLDPSDDIYFSSRARAQELLGNYKNAITDYDLAIGIDPMCARLYYERGNIKVKIGKYQNAIFDFDKAIQIENTPSNIRYIDNREHYYQSKGCAIVQMGDKSRMKEAIEALDKALEVALFRFEDDDVAECRKIALEKLKN